LKKSTTPTRLKILIYIKIFSYYFPNNSHKWWITNLEIN